MRRSESAEAYSALASRCSLARSAGDGCEAGNGGPDATVLSYEDFVSSLRIARAWAAARASLVKRIMVRVSRFQGSGIERRAHFDNAEATSLLSSGGRSRISFKLGVCSASERTTVLICWKRPLALQNCATAKPSLSSFALRSTSEIPRSRSYEPRATTFSLARFERAKP